MPDKNEPIVIDCNDLDTIYERDALEACIRRVKVWFERSAVVMRTGAAGEVGTSIAFELSARDNAGTRFYEVACEETINFADIA